MAGFCRPLFVTALSKAMMVFVSDMMLRCYVTCYLSERTLPVPVEQPVRRLRFFFWIGVDGVA